MNHGEHADHASRPALARALGLTAHPEGGWYRRTWRAGPTLTPAGYPGERPCATAIHYLLGPGEESVWHRVRSDELWFWHRGVPLRLWIGGDGERPDTTATPVLLGPRVEDGELPQVLVPGGSWQRARPDRAEGRAGRHGAAEGGGDGGAVLVSCVVAPGFDFADFTTADVTDTD